MDYFQIQTEEFPIAEARKCLTAKKKKKIGMDLDLKL